MGEPQKPELVTIQTHGLTLTSLARGGAGVKVSIGEASTVIPCDVLARAAELLRSTETPKPRGLGISSLLRAGERELKFRLDYDGAMFVD